MIDIAKKSAHSPEKCRTKEDEVTKNVWILRDVAEV